MTAAIKKINDWGIGMLVCLVAMSLYCTILFASTGVGGIAGFGGFFAGIIGFVIAGFMRFSK